MSERVGVEQTPDIEAVLAEHSTVATGLGEWCCKCSPGEWRPTAHRSSHLAQALAPVLAAAEAKARAAELREAADAAETNDLPHGDGDWLDGACDTILWLRDRADRIDVDAPDGGEGR